MMIISATEHNIRILEVSIILSSYISDKWDKQQQWQHSLQLLCFVGVLLFYCFTFYNLKLPLTSPHLHNIGENHILSFTFILWYLSSDLEGDNLIYPVSSDYPAEIEENFYLFSTIGSGESASGSGGGGSNLINHPRFYFRQNWKSEENILAVTGQK